MKPVHTFPRIATDETLRETVSHGRLDYPFQYYLENVWEFDLHCIDWHWHPELEMIYVNSGETLVSIGGEQVPVPEGCGMLINGRMVHRFQSKRSTWMPNIVFRLHFLRRKAASFTAGTSSRCWRAAFHTACSIHRSPGTEKCCGSCG